MCAEGDIEGIVELLRDIESDPDRPTNTAQLLLYRDSLDGMKSGLHRAVETRQEGIAWLLLWLASSLPVDRFPPAVVQTMQTMAVPKHDPAAFDEDIRALKDEQGRTAADLAIASGDVAEGLAVVDLLVYPG
jgi:hypothetical protein